MTKWKRMKRRQERKRMQEEQRKQSTEQEPTLVEETPNDVQISQKLSLIHISEPTRPY